MQEGQRFIDVLDLVHAHLAVVWFAQLLSGDDLQQPEQLPAVGQVGEDVLHLHTRLKRDRSKVLNIV